ncbi:hypothetical protein BD779DRAFT_1569529 [Infundibulicybe gibba]|nr:hypothetical protein BD779DRAFT_1569529 [Infundibulicybe gibba]
MARIAALEASSTHELELSKRVEMVMAYLVSTPVSTDGTFYYRDREHMRGMGVTHVSSIVSIYLPTSASA